MIDFVSKRRRILLPTSTFKWGESNTYGLEKTEQKKRRDKNFSEETKAILSIHEVLTNRLS